VNRGRRVDLPESAIKKPRPKWSGWFLRCDTIQQRLAFPQGTQHRIYLVAGQNPTPMRQFGNDRPLEALIKVQRLFFIEEMVGQNCQCQLCRAAAAIKDIG